MPLGHGAEDLEDAVVEHGGRVLAGLRAHTRVVDRRVAEVPLGRRVHALQPDDAVHRVDDVRLRRVGVAERRQGHQLARVLEAVRRPFVGKGRVRDRVEERVAGAGLDQHRDLARDLPPVVDEVEAPDAPLPHEHGAQRRVVGRGHPAGHRDVRALVRRT